MFIDLSNLKDKSNFSIISADMLMKAGYHASSIHCSYYGLFQWMKYTMKGFLKITYEEYSDNARASSLNSHAYLINLVYDSFQQKGYSKKDAHDIRRKILDLKELRETADYDNVKMISDDSDLAFSNSGKLIKVIQTTFKI